ncbi:unnamed protein product [Schistosoma rodhaini]|uniref:Uncharacterized protein n=1 Tax=Schistosoma rodhaini TaxID=6188 RepID=A0AA85EUD5_9TREM|nr:unnamed protein product [Schistosoma rodhaini]
MAGDRVLGKPPRPRLSHSPSSASNCSDRRHQYNYLTSKLNHITQNQCGIKISKNDCVNIKCSKHRDSEDSICVTSQDDNDNDNYDVQKLSDIVNQTSIYNDDDGEELEEEKDDNKEYLAKNQISQWIDQILEPSKTLNSLSVNSAKFNHNQKPEAVYSPISNPEDDILAQWRLRRRMEQARMEISKESYPRSNEYIQLATPFSSITLPQYSQFPDQNKTSYNLPSICQSTFESNKSFPIKIHIKDTYVQCDILKNSSTNDSQIQTNQSVLNASFNCLKSINLFNESNIRDVGTATDGIISKTGLEAKHKSIRVMVRPQSRNVKLQTPLNMISSNITNGSNNRPMNKNLCISVDKTSHQQHQQTTTMTMTNDTTIADNNTLVDYNIRVPQFLPVDISESAQSIESDSWIWPATPPSIRNDKNSNHLTTSTCDSYIGQEIDYQQHHTSRPSEKISNQTSTHLPGPTSTELTSSKSAFDKEVQIGLTIARYMEENLNNVEGPDQRFPEDEILHDLRRRRTNCILKMRLVMKQIHEREAQLLNN